MPARKIPVLALIAVVSAWMTAGVAAQDTQPVVTRAPAAAATAPSPADNPYAAALTLDGFVERTGVMAYP